MFRFLALCFLITYSSVGLSNENLIKLNNLYLNGVLDKEMYFKSLNKLGIDIDNEIFQNLFDLFSDRTIDQQNYEKSLSNLVSLSNEGISKKESSADTNKNNSFNGILSKKYTISRCIGEGDVCITFKPGGEIIFTYADGKVNWPNEIKNEVLLRPDLLNVVQEKFSTFGGNKFQSTFIVRHSRGMLVNFIADGDFNKDPFHVEKTFIRVNGKDIATIFYK